MPAPDKRSKRSDIRKTLIESSDTFPDKKPESLAKDPSPSADPPALPPRTVDLMPGAEVVEPVAKGTSRQTSPPPSTNKPTSSKPVEKSNVEEPEASDGGSHVLGPSDSIPLESSDERSSVSAIQVSIFDQDEDSQSAEVVPPQRGKRFYPTTRPPMARLHVMDDNQSTGEWFRIRTTPCILGRVEGDIVVPHDSQMSGCHAQVTRDETAPGEYRWYLEDLNSTNGVFVAVDRIRLKSEDELLVGSRRFRFRQPPASAGPATLTEILPPNRDGERIELTEREHWIGRDPEVAAAFLHDDELLDARHARLTQQADGRWVVQDSNSRNGVWYRVQRIPLVDTCRFQLGEQRFRFLLH